MSQSENIKINKREYWQDKIKKWKESNLSQSKFCKQAGIKLSTLGYWLKLLLEPEKRNGNKFVPIKIIKDIKPKTPVKSIKIKLLTGHVVYLPVEIGINEITKLIHLLGMPHA
jgi:hypothetical protein